jgi:hypothetical protein
VAHEVHGAARGHVADARIDANVRRGCAASSAVSPAGPRAATARWRGHGSARGSGSGCCPASGAWRCAWGTPAAQGDSDSA